MGNDIITIEPSGKRMLVKASPNNHHYNGDTNIMGLLALSFFGLHLIKGNIDGFDFDRMPEYL